ncbi:MAG: gamma-glutamyl-gamma-aminobutyrate hydrolase family protein [Bullifex sp.]
MSRKPLIGIAAETISGDMHKGAFRYDWYMAISSYVRGIMNAGADPVILIPGSDPARMISMVDGLLLQGGKDISPSLYGEEKTPECGPNDIIEDKFHIDLIKEAIRQKKPILGICRGLQIINVTLGGTLYQHLPNQEHKHFEDYENPSHTITVVPGTKLASIFGEGILPVNSLHHQGIKKIAPSLAAAAYSPDGLIEAVEADGIIALQCHPEALKEKHGEYQRLFDFFIENCKIRT